MYIIVHVTSVIRAPERNNKMAIARIFNLAGGLMIDTKGTHRGVARNEVITAVQLKDKSSGK